MRRAIVSLLLSFVASVVVPVASAPDPLSVSVGGVWVCKITQPAAGFTPQQRVSEANKRITEVISRLRQADRVTVVVEPFGSAAKVTVNGILVFTLIPADVPAPGVALAEYARQVAARLQKGIVNGLPGR
ncbi:MAG TPA: hypothetical protein VFL31_00360 [Nitrospiraceae bacterium]|nr:hypothetical protein [Nitrospiraceae bacterium]